MGSGSADMKASWFLVAKPATDLNCTRNKRPHCILYKVLTLNSAELRSYKQHVNATPTAKQASALEMGQYHDFNLDAILTNTANCDIDDLQVCVYCHPKLTFNPLSSCVLCLKTGNRRFHWWWRHPIRQFELLVVWFSCPLAHWVGPTSSFLVFLVSVSFHLPI